MIINILGTPIYQRFVKLPESLLPIPPYSCMISADFQKMENYMDIEFDLHPYLVILKQRWPWIIVGTIITIIVASSITLLIPKAYEATAIVIVKEPSDIVQFDARFRTLDETQPLKALPELAKSDELLQSLFSAGIVADSVHATTIDDLRNKLTAEPGIDPSIIRLSALAMDPSDAATLANGWANLFVETTNKIFKDSNGDQVRFFETKLTEASDELSFAEQALIEFETINNTTIISTTLDAYTKTQINYLDVQRKSTFLLQDVQRLQEQINTLSGTTEFSEELTILSMQLRAFNAEFDVPFLIEINTLDSIITSSPSEQEAILNSLISSLEAQTSVIELNLVELEPLILDLQKQRQELQTEANRLTRNFELAQETYSALARKLEEERITSQDTSSGAQLFSHASVPNLSTRPHPFSIIALTAVFGFLLSSISMFAYEWLKQDESV